MSNMWALSLSQCTAMEHNAQWCGTRATARLKTWMSDCLIKSLSSWIEWWLRCSPDVPLFCFHNSLLKKTHITQDATRCGLCVTLSAMMATSAVGGVTYRSNRSTGERHELRNSVNQTTPNTPKLLRLLIYETGQCFVLFCIGVPAVSVVHSSSIFFVATTFVSRLCGWFVLFTGHWWCREVKPSL